jgi:acyl-CoA thioesterase
MTEKSLATQVIDQMYHNDPFSLWMGVERMAESEGYCLLRMRVRKDMLNGFGIMHGGVAFSLADSALAFASNSHGVKSVSIEASISLVESVVENEVLIAEAVEQSRSNKIAIYHVTLKKEEGPLVGIFKGIVYRTGKDWILDQDTSK